MVPYQGGHDAGRPVRVVPIELHLEGKLGGPVKCIPVDLWGRSKSGQWLAIVALVVLDVRLNQSHERVNRRLDGAAPGCKIVFQGSRGPGARCFRKHDDSETAGCQCHTRERIGTRTERDSSCPCFSLYRWARSRKSDSR